MIQLPFDKYQDQKISENLLNYGFANYSIGKGVQKDEPVGEAAVEKGKVKFVQAAAKQDFNKLLPKSGKLEKRVELAQNIRAPIKKGDTVGTIRFFTDNTEAGIVDAVAANDVDRVTVFDTMVMLLKRWSGK